MTIYCIRDRSDDARALEDERFKREDTSMVNFCFRRTSLNLNENSVIENDSWTFKKYVDGHVAFAIVDARTPDTINTTVFCKDCVYEFIKRYLEREESQNG